MSNKRENVADKAIVDLKKYKEVLDKELTLFFKRQLNESKKIDESAYQAIKAAEEYTLRGGKRIRAALMFYGFLCFSRKVDKKELARASMSMELLQSFLLIHDDIIDRDELRRGRPTMHKIFEKSNTDGLYFSSAKERKHFGGSMAILVGDICASLASIILSETRFKNKADAIHELNKVVRDVTFGQILDLRSGYANTFSEKTTLKIYRSKTANYSIEMPIKLGAILAGAPEEDIEKIRSYAEPLGVAFNIQDDLLELFGEKKKFGKPVGSDLKEGKRTLIVLKTLKVAPKIDAIFIKNNLGNRAMTSGDIEKIKKSMVETGALDYCVKYARDLIKKSNRIIEEQKYLPQGKSFISGIGDYLLERDY